MFFIIRNELFISNIWSDMGKMEVVDNLSDGIFYLAWTLYMLNYFRVETGIAVMSLFSIGATGTLVSMMWKLYISVLFCTLFNGCCLLIWQVLGLASKDIASQVLSGIFLHMSNKMFEVCCSDIARWWVILQMQFLIGFSPYIHCHTSSQGDTVRFSDGTSGKIENMGWFETYIRNSDELVVAYPNSQVRWNHSSSCSS